MRCLRILVVFMVLAFTVLNVTPVNAQCAVCTTNVSSNNSNGGTQANGLNKGIVYLLFAPYIAVAAVGFIWYKKYRRKNVSLNMRDDKLHLN